MKQKISKAFTLQKNIMYHTFFYATPTLYLKKGSKRKSVKIFVQILNRVPSSFFKR